MMKKSTFLINVARGGIVDETALYNALRKKWIAGAGLDVLESEPAKDKKLLKLKNCIVTPHIAGLTIERYRACGRVAVEEVKRVLNGGMPSLENLVNPEVLSIKK
jgi:D-3-phosphoglycerate dehydrogenase